MPESWTELRERMLPELQRALQFAAGQARRVSSNYPGYTPMYTVQGRWNREGERWTNWCEGFFPGILWLLHKQTGEAEWRALAEQYSRPLEPRRFDRDVHDLGFLFFSTYLRWYRLSQEERLRGILVDAGRTLALRRQKAGYLSSFVGPQSLFIDIMMNVGIILWAANAVRDDQLREIALEHCRTTQRYLVRRDGGTAHEGIFHTHKGTFLRTSTHQGWSAASTWSRGQAWAAGAPFLILQAMLGISARAPENLLTVNHPHLPPWLNTVELRGLRVGTSRISLVFRREGDITGFSLLSRDGDVRVVMEE